MVSKIYESPTDKLNAYGESFFLLFLNRGVASGCTSCLNHHNKKAG